MLPKKLVKYINSRETFPVALTEEAKQFKLTYTEGDFSIEILNEALMSIENELIWAINIGNHIPKTKKAKVEIFNGAEKLGFLKINLEETLSLKGENIYLYKILSARTFLLPAYSIIPDYFAYTIKKKFRNIKDLSRLRKLFVYYLKPKPSFLLSVKSLDKFDIFPIDLTGRISKDYFSLAVKSTNKGIDIIKSTKALCLSAVPFSMINLVYKHSEQRKKGMINLGNLTFSVSESQTLKIPVPDFAIYVNELHVEQIFEKGLYTVFIMKSVNKYILSDALQVAHTPWYNKQFFTSVLSPVNSLTR